LKTYEKIGPVIFFLKGGGQIFSEL